MRASEKKGALSRKTCLHNLERYAFNGGMTEAVLNLVKEKLGGNAGVAAKLGAITPQAVSQWKMVPVRRVLELERLTQISRHELRPDIFGPSPKAERVA